MITHREVGESILAFCKELGFATIAAGSELVRLDEDIALLCQPFRGGDSWLYLRVGPYSLLNTNDCVIRDGDFSPLTSVVGEVDILLSKFSYASWSGNPLDSESRSRIAERKLLDLGNQVRAFTPAVTVPIASHVWFCHHDNHYLNDHMNSPGDAHRFLSATTNTLPLILYCGEQYPLSHRSWDSHEAIRRFDRDIQLSVESGPLFKEPTSIPAEELSVECGSLVASAAESQPRASRKHPLSCVIYLSDHQCAFRISRRDGMVAVNASVGDCDVVLASDSLQLCVKYATGVETVRMSGRMWCPEHGQYARFRNFFESVHDAAIQGV